MVGRAGQASIRADLSASSWLTRAGSAASSLVLGDAWSKCVGMNQMTNVINRALGSVAVATLLFTSSVQAATLTFTLDEFNGGANDVGPFPTAAQTVGTFEFHLPPGLSIIAASLSGTFGNSISSSSAGADVFADGSLVAQCIRFALCYRGGPGFWETTPWTFDFSDFSSLSDGSLVLTVMQTSEIFIRLGETTLRIETGPPSAVPLPGALPLFGSVLALGGWVASRKKRQDAPVRRS